MSGTLALESQSRDSIHKAKKISMVNIQKDCFIYDLRGVCFSERSSLTNAIPQNDVYFRFAGRLKNKRHFSCKTDILLLPLQGNL